LNASRRLQSGLYNNESFYAKTEDKVDPKIVAQFKEWTREAKQLAEARLKKNPKDTEALYFLGATQGLKAAFAGAVERSFVSALRSGSDAVDRHRETIKLDPGFHDAELTIGMQDYIVGGLALPYKILAGMTGTRGSKKRGLATLERVMREGQWARDDARVMLIPLYKREKRFADAAALARELAAKYPKNYLFKLEYADALVSQAAAEREQGGAASSAATEREAFAIFDALLRDRAARDAAARQLDLIHFQYGEALFVAGQFERAAREFLAAASVPGAEANQATLGRLRAAQTLDLAGRREEALAQYKQVAARPNVYDSHEEARRGLREPYRKAAPKQAEEN
jgi:tetratricopeptide (TPR) repeat protein